ncbi:MAG TPA: ribonuclease H-like domain-containing protein [Anaerolineaceae bacterium]|nr:ribonuclease H-like domain-containing protein [Anaerolineaceae bacterium]
MNTLLDHLKSLGVELGKEKKDYKKRELEDLTGILGGTWLETPYGRTFHSQQIFDLQAAQGDVLLKCTRIGQKVLDLFNISHVLENSALLPTQICFFDTETSSLSLGSGAFVFLTGFSHFQEDGSVCVDQFFLPHPSEERAFIYAVQEFLGHFSILSSYNGKSFDVPMLRSRFIFHDMEDDGLEKTHLDLLFLARALWKRRLESCRLVEIEEAILHFKRTGEDVPGWLVPILYQDYLREGHAAPLKSVFYHNTQDVVSLAALFNVIHAMLDQEMQYAIEFPEDYASLAYLYEKLGNREQAETYFDAYFSSLAGSADPEVLYDYAWMQRRNENWSVAVKYWHLAAEQDHLPAMVELAKYYEHQVKNVQQAMQWLERIKQYDPVKRSLLKDDLRKRALRLERKSNKNVEN